MFCKHKWAVLSEKITESKAQHLANLRAPENSPGPFSFFARKHIQIVTCEKCGKLKRFVEEI